jgi:DNA-binding NarL/FixJ family response regulator
MVMTNESQVKLEGKARRRTSGAWSVVLTTGFMMSREDCEPALLMTKREMEVLHGVAQGKTAKDIGWGFTPALSPKTIETHLDHVKKKLDLESIQQVRVWAVKYFLAEAQFGLRREELPKRRTAFRFVPVETEVVA